MTPSYAQAVSALENLKSHQRQLDADGVEVGVSRQAMDEVITAYEAALSACAGEKPSGIVTCPDCGNQHGAKANHRCTASPPEALRSAERLAKEMLEGLNNVNDTLYHTTLFIEIAQRNAIASVSGGEDEI